MKTQTILKEVKTTGNQEMVFDQGGQFYKESFLNPFLFQHGRSEYFVEKFVFFDEEGYGEMINSGWFGNNNKYDTLGFRTDEEFKPLKKKSKIDLSTKDVYFMSNGKDFSGNNKATVYVPYAFLSNMGYKIVETVNDDEFSKYTRKEMITPFFTNLQETNMEKKFHAVKAAFLEEVEKANSREEIEKVWSKYVFKF